MDIQNEITVLGLEMSQKFNCGRIVPEWDSLFNSDESSYNIFPELEAASISLVPVMKNHLNSEFKNYPLFPYFALVILSRVMAYMGPDFGERVVLVQRALVAIRKWCDEQKVAGLREIDSLNDKVKLVEAGISPPGFLHMYSSMTLISALFESSYPGIVKIVYARVIEAVEKSKPGDSDLYFQVAYAVTRHVSALFTDTPHSPLEIYGTMPEPFGPLNFEVFTFPHTLK